ncbi:hypothetical protein [Herbaspirillum chlorophenolicum]|uniref:hypothetical protein n=1 Tax=Herbaspirillum chlorophenolicum TaxID=211589 RepID=UPI0014715224|nr:hypothetical protein [Herbaspirillum chlorophenolicum]
MQVFFTGFPRKTAGKQRVRAIRRQAAPVKGLRRIAAGRERLFFAQWASSMA